MEEYSGSEALDAGLLAATQAVEHYEIRATAPEILGGPAWAERRGQPAR
jgi:ferritin-like metal-binding protein YciE